MLPFSDNSKDKQTTESKSYCSSSQAELTKKTPIASDLQEAWMLTDPHSCLLQTSTQVKGSEQVTLAQARGARQESCTLVNMVTSARGVMLTRGGRGRLVPETRKSSRHPVKEQYEQRRNRHYHYINTTINILLLLLLLEKYRRTINRFKSKVDGNNIIISGILHRVGAEHSFLRQGIQHQ